VQSFHESMSRRGGRMHAVLRDIVAFSNTNGGTIYVGVSPNAKVAPKGIETPEQALKELRTEAGRLITPPVEIELGLLKSDGKDIVRVSVNKGPDIPYALEGSKIYLRQEGETVLAMRDQIVSLILKTVGTQQSSSTPTQAPRPTSASDAVPSSVPPKQEQRPSRSSRSRRSRSATSKPKAETSAAERPQFVTAQPESVQPDSVSAQGQADNGLPKTGVEIVDTVNRDGVLYHTMCDLRDGGQVHNVTRVSARRLWRYAIALKEKSAFQEDRVKWTGDLGLWHKYLRAGRPHYDLVQRVPNGDPRVYYGVTEDGIYGPWRAVVGMED